MDEERKDFGPGIRLFLRGGTVGRYFGSVSDHHHHGDGQRGPPPWLRDSYDPPCEVGLNTVISPNIQTESSKDLPLIYAKGAISTAFCTASL